MKFSLRFVYLYLVSFIGLLVCVIALVSLVDLGIKAFVFKDADKYEYYNPTPADVKYDEAQAKKNADVEQMRSRQRTASNSVAMLLVGVPLYVYHWRLIQKELASQA